MLRLIPGKSIELINIVKLYSGIMHIINAQKGEFVHRFLEELFLHLETLKEINEKNTARACVIPLTCFSNTN